MLCMYDNNVNYNLFAPKSEELQQACCMYTSDSIKKYAADFAAKLPKPGANN